MSKKKVDLSSFDNTWYKPGSSLKRGIWYLFNVAFFLNPWFPFRRFKVFLIRLFGAKVGRGVVIKPRVNIKYPWNLKIGNNSWIGEGVWIDNLAEVNIGSHVCVSQGAYLLCGNHDYGKTTFDLIIRPIVIEDGAWVGAKAIVAPGVVLKTHAVLTAGSVATKDADAYGIYTGNPAQLKKERVIS